MTRKARKLVVHMVGNAHLDPAWLWTWQAGVDEALATCRTACDLLDEYPDLHVTRGEAWMYYQIQKLDPTLFKRMARHVKAGRLNVVNGWWIQPDCNQPMRESFLKQSEVGGRFFKESLGIAVKVGYNVDSFGHCAMLPSFLKQGGKDFYVFSRPGAHEMTLPSNLFRWRSPDGKEVIAFRLAGYGASSLFDMKKNLAAELAAAPAGVGHTMCFYGIGDHGGGPTRDQIEWIQEHKHHSDDVELRLSHPAAFFAAVKSQKASFPVVTGELNPHAVGCYTVVRDIKREVRRAEVMLLEAEKLVAKSDAAKDKSLKNRIEEAWRTVLFNQFHDVMCGSSIKSVCTQALEELGAVKSFARELIVDHTRKANVKLPPCPRQRIVIDNPHEAPWEGYAEFNPWFQQDGAPNHFALQDEIGEPVPYQSILTTYLATGRNNILFPVQIPAGGRKIVEIRRLMSPLPPVASPLRVEGQSLSNETIALSCGQKGISSLSLKGQPVIGPDGISVCAFEDYSDTWSHGILSYEGPKVETFTAEKPWSILESGPIRAALDNTLHSESGKLRWTVQLVDGGKSLRLRLSLNWWGVNKIVKLVIPPGFEATIRRDGTPGAVIKRPMDKREYPVMDVISVAGKGASLTAISPDIYSADVLPDGTMRITLLRCPPYALHEPAKPEFNAIYPTTDQGVHDYEIELVPAAAFNEAEALEIAGRLNRPLWISETTKGMPSGWRYDNPPKKLPAAMPPVAPADALMARDLLKLAEGLAASIVPAGKLCMTWAGEHLLVPKGKSLRLNVPVPVESKYRLSVARLSGKGFGELHINLYGQHVVTFPSSKARPVPSLDVIPGLMLPGGIATLELNVKGRDKLAVGFLQLVPIYKDIPASAWMVAGPFIYADGKSGDPHANVEHCINQTEYLPETARDFDSPFKLVDGSSANWKSIEGDSDYVDFHAITGKKAGSIHYAVTNIWSDARRRVGLSYGVDFFHRMWLNGQIIVPFSKGLGAPYKGQFTMNVELEKGWNELRFKVASGSGGNGLWMAISDSGNLKFSSRMP